MSFESLSPNPSAPAAEAPRDHPLLSLTEEDLNLITELVLQSGSLKALARSYGVSYPTIRSRLDRTIERLLQAVEGRTPDPVAALLAAMVERDELTARNARAIMRAIEQTNPGPHTTQENRS